MVRLVYDQTLFWTGDGHDKAYRVYVKAIVDAVAGEYQVMAQWGRRPLGPTSQTQSKGKFFHLHSAMDLAERLIAAKKAKGYLPDKDLVMDRFGAERAPVHLEDLVAQALNSPERIDAAIDAALEDI